MDEELMVKNTEHLKSMILRTESLDSETKEKAIKGLDKMSSSSRYRDEVRYCPTGVSLQASFIFVSTDEGREFWDAVQRAVRS